MVKKERVVLTGTFESSRDRFRKDVKIKKVRLMLLKELIKRLQK
jgi:hypothetical protein